MMDKRWHRRREAWVTPPVRFRPAGFTVDVVAERLARPFILEHHYAGSFPAARLCVGLFGPGRELVGVAVFSVPMQGAAIPAWTGMAASEGVELGRFVCAPSVAFNGESWFLARCWPLLLREKQGVRVVLSYADPLERRTAAGELTKRAHWGTIYQATNALHVGRSSPRTMLITSGGSIVSGRALSKIRRGERGWEYATRQLIAAGAPPRRFGEGADSWVRRATAAFRRLRHPGNLVYVFGLEDAAVRDLKLRHGGGLAYPRRSAA